MIVILSVNHYGKNQWLHRSDVARDPVFPTIWEQYGSYETLTQRRDTIVELFRWFRWLHT